MYILVCRECGYERSSEQDGKMFEEDPRNPDELICHDCISDLVGQGQIKIEPN